IGKSRATPLEGVAEDYLYTLRKLRAHADYIALNTSSPNTPGLRELQQQKQLADLLGMIKGEVAGKPLLVKIAPDLESSPFDELIAVCEQEAVAGIIATNTTLDHSAVANDEE